MKINESGRSMIEMLGVLAIIGVLSVGGIAGYSKAMAKFRANKTIDHVSHIVANTRILFGSQKDYSDLSNEVKTKQLIGRAKLFPEDVIVRNNDGEAASFSNAYAGNISLTVSNRLQDLDNKAFMISLDGIPQDACIDLASQDWNASSGSGFVALLVGPASSKNSVAAGTNNDGDPVTTSFDNTMKATYMTTCNNHDASGADGGSDYSLVCGNMGKPMSVISATLGCSDRDNNVMLFKFY